MCCFTHHHQESSLMCGDVLGLHTGWELEERYLMKDHRVQENCEQSTRTKPSLFGPAGIEGVRSGTPFIRTAFYFHKTDVCPAALLPVSSPTSHLSHNLQNRNCDPPWTCPRACPTNGLWSFLAFRAKRQTNTPQGSCVLGRANETPHTISGVLFGFIFFKLPALGGD